MTISINPKYAACYDGELFVGIALSGEYLRGIYGSTKDHYGIWDVSIESIGSFIPVVEGKWVGGGMS